MSHPALSRISSAALALLLAGACTFAAAVLGRAEVLESRAESPHIVPEVEAPAQPTATRRRVTPEERTSRVDAPVAETEDDAPAAGPWVVVLRGPGDVALEGITVAVDDHEDAMHATTDATGTAVLPWFEDRATLKVEIDGHVPVDWVVLEERRTVVRYPDLVPLRVRFIDALTGTVLQGGSVIAHGEFGARRALTRKGDTFELFPAPFARNDHDGGIFDFDAPGGFAGDAYAYRSFRVSPLADGARIDVPVWRAGVVNVQVVDAEGAPVAGATVKPPTLSGFGAYGTETETDGEGLAVFHGIPMVPDETIRADAAIPDRFATTTSSPVAPSQSRVDITVALPPEPRSRKRTGGCGGCGGVSMSVRRAEMPEGGELDLDVRVLLRSGRPARGVRVFALGERNHEGFFQNWKGKDHATDAKGRATLGAVHPSITQVVAIAPGMTPILHEIGAADLGAEVTLHEPEGETVRVRVVTPDGRPVAGALVEADLRSWKLSATWDHAEITDGFQAEGLLTDADGRVTLRGIAHCTVEIEADLGSRDAEGRAEPGDEITLVLE